MQKRTPVTMTTENCVGLRHSPAILSFYSTSFDANGSLIINQTKDHPFIFGMENRVSDIQQMDIFQDCALPTTNFSTQSAIGLPSLPTCDQTTLNDTVDCVNSIVERAPVSQASTNENDHNSMPLSEKFILDSHEKMDILSDKRKPEAMADERLLKKFCLIESNSV